MRDDRYEWKRSSSLFSSCWTLAMWCSLHVSDISRDVLLPLVLGVSPHSLHSHFFHFTTPRDLRPMTDALGSCLIARPNIERSEYSDGYIDKHHACSA
jgi:hypothetical protein